MTVNPLYTKALITAVKKPEVLNHSMLAVIKENTYIPCCNLQFFILNFISV